ncbi:MAG: serine/threonine-protein kinase RIO2 [Halobacteriales archaeon]|nr:serine/threonine-protein kinase RIO2 [Halobacteriales archaeon]
MVRNVAEGFIELEPEDFYLLSGVEHGMRFSRWVNREKLPDLTDLSPDDVTYRLDRCLDRGLIERKTIQYEGYRLQFEGYDALALRALTERDSIDAFGAPLGVGKESDVYEVQGTAGPLALKFHREGVTNFRRVARERDYTADREHVSILYTARKAAEREYGALEALHPTVSVPEPIDQNRHAIVMGKIDGVELSRARLPADRALSVLDRILTQVRLAYEAGYIHADMSEFNVAVTERTVTVFDWPQAVPTDHENAEELLVRDIENLLGHFRRKYPKAVPEDVDAASIADRIKSADFETVSA